ncbi:MAG: LicD family protein [Victivallaceae bacterium]|nr:LicD family protein [Victivallaceae bacterium]
MTDKNIDLEELRKIQLDILRKVSAFCGENEISYYLGYGTLLGAVRHGGYIPWDDDIDLIIPRPDYLRFLEIFDERNKCPELKVLSHYKDEMHPYPYIKLINTRTSFTFHSSIKYEMGVCIDIFPLDGLPDSVWKSNLLYFNVYFFQKFYQVKFVAFRKDQNLVKKIILLLTKTVLLPFNYQFFIKKINELARTYDYADSRFCGVLTMGNGRRERTGKDLFQKTVLLEFEGSKFSAPRNYDLWLKHLYGDYMTPPPVGKRGSLHVFTAHWR